MLLFKANLKEEDFYQNHLMTSHIIVRNPREDHFKISLLYNKTKHPIKQGELITLTHLPRRTIQNALDELKQQGLVTEEIVSMIPGRRYTLLYTQIGFR